MGNVIIRLGPVTVAVGLKSPWIRVIRERSVLAGNGEQFKQTGSL